MGIRGKQRHKKMSSGVMDPSFLPEGCIAKVLSLTTPRDACRLSLVSSTFRSASESDAVWERFLPENYQEIVGRASVDSSVVFKTKKELYLYLCDHFLILDDGTKSFSLDKWSGKNCYMLAARDLTIVWGDTPRYWKWSSSSESRFKEVAELLSVCWLEIRGTINTSLLSANTVYAAYLVFKSTSEAYGFDYRPAEGWVGISGGEGEKRNVYLDCDSGREASPAVEGNGQNPKERGDGWLEIELGEYVNKEGDGELEMSLMEVKRLNWKSGLIVQGIEIRPKEKVGV